MWHAGISSSEPCLIYPFLSLTFLWLGFTLLVDGYLCHSRPTFNSIICTLSLLSGHIMSSFQYPAEGRVNLFKPHTWPHSSYISFSLKTASESQGAAPAIWLYVFVTGHTGKCWRQRVYKHTPVPRGRKFPPTPYPLSSMTSDPGLVTFWLAAPLRLCFMIRQFYPLGAACFGLLGMLRDRQK